MTDDQIEVADLKERLAKLETTVNKSNFSAGLALSLENINKGINETVADIDIAKFPNIKPQVECAAAVVMNAFTAEIDRLRQKG